MLLSRSWKRLLAIFLVTVYIVVFMHIPSYAQMTIPREQASGYELMTITRGPCNQYQESFLLGDICIPNYRKMPVSVALGDLDWDGISEYRLPADIVDMIYGYSLPYERPGREGPINMVLPIVLLSDDGTTPYLNHFGLTATIGEITGNNLDFTANDIPAFRDYFTADNPYRIEPVSQYQIMKEAYLDSGTEFGRKTLLRDNIPNREEIIRRIGEECYYSLGLGNMTLAEVVEFLDQTYRDYENYFQEEYEPYFQCQSSVTGDGSVPIPEDKSLPIQDPYVQKAIAFAWAMAKPVIRKYLENPIKEGINGLGWAKVAANNFSQLMNTTLGDLFGGQFIALEKAISQIPDVPIPIPVFLANTDVGAIGRSPGVYLNDFAGGFTCLTGDDNKSSVAEGTEVVPTEESKRLSRGPGNSARLLLGNGNNPDFFFRVEGYPVTCHDKDARGILGALSGYRGYQVTAVWKIDTRLLTIYFQFGLVITLDTLSYEPRIKLCIKKQNWMPFDPGCTGAGVLGGGFKLPTVRLGQVGIIFINPRAMAESLVKMIKNLKIKDLVISLMSYMLNYVDAQKLSEILRTIDGGLQLLQYLPEAERRRSNGQYMDIMPERPERIVTASNDASSPIHLAFKLQEKSRIGESEKSVYILQYYYLPIYSTGESS